MAVSDIDIEYSEYLYADQGFCIFPRKDSISKLFHKILNTFPAKSYGTLVVCDCRKNPESGITYSGNYFCHEFMMSNLADFDELLQKDTGVVITIACHRNARVTLNPLKMINVVSGNPRCLQKIEKSLYSWHIPRGDEKEISYEKIQEHYELESHDEMVRQFVEAFGLTLCR